MEEMVGYCGYSCHLCAARSEDPAVRQRLVDGWRRIFGHEHYTAENVRCDGCLSEGRLADKDCAARPCARERNLESCACCAEFPCKKMSKLMGTREGLLIFCGRPSLTGEEYNLCMRQFASMPNIIRVMVKAGKLPAWAAEEAAAAQ